MARIKEDVRIIKTKRKLVTAFQRLLDSKKFEDITVNEICDQADIRRATFYKHFTDKYDFLHYFVKTLRDNFDNRAWHRNRGIGTVEYYADYVRGLVNFLVKNEEIIDKVLESSVFSTLIDIIIDQNYIDTREHLEKSVAAGLKLPVSVNTMAMMLTGAVSNALVRWFSCGRKTPENVLVEEICTVVNIMIKGSNTHSNELWIK